MYAFGMTGRWCALKRSAGRYLVRLAAAGILAFALVAPPASLAEKTPASFHPGDPFGDQASSSNVLWSVRLGSQTYPSPAVSDNFIIIGTNDANLDDDRLAVTRGGLVLCLDRISGSLKWQLPIPRLSEQLPGGAFDDLNLGVCSTATIDEEAGSKELREAIEKSGRIDGRFPPGGFAYVVTNRAEVICLDLQGQANGNDGPFKDEGKYMSGGKDIELKPTDADIIWKFDMIADVPCMPHDASHSGVLIVGDYLYVGTSNGIHRRVDRDTPMPDAPTLIVLDKKTGKLVGVDDEKIGRRMFHGQWSSPVAARIKGKTQILYGAGDGVLYAFEPLTAKDVKAASVAGVSPMSVARVSPARHAGIQPAFSMGVSPVISPWSLAFTDQMPWFPLAMAPVLLAQDADAPSDKPAILKKIWSYDCNPPHFKKDPAGKDIDYWAGDASRAKVPPNFIGPSEIIAAPVAADDRVYIATGQDPVHGIAPAVLHCIDATRQGDVTKTAGIWSFERINRSMTTVAVDAGLVYAADLSGRVYCLDAASGKLHWVHETGHEIWSSPLIVENKVFIGTQKGDFYAFAHSKDRKTIAKTPLKFAVANRPAVRGDTLYVACQTRLFAVGFKPEQIPDILIPDGLEGETYDKLIRD